MFSGHDVDPPDGSQLNLAHLTRTTATVVVGHVQLAQRRLRRGEDRARVDGHLAAIEAAMRAFVAHVEQLEHRHDEPPDA